MLQSLFPRPQVVVMAESPAVWTTATELAHVLTLPLVVEGEVGGTFLAVVVTETRLELREIGSPHAPGPVFVDFVAGPSAHRWRFGGGRNQPLARAVGLKGTRKPTVIDATGGLGQDAFVLASLGCQVRLIERSPIIAALLRDGLQRAAQDAEIGDWVRERLSLEQRDSRDYLRQLPEAQYPDVIYLDPMYPHRRNTALNRKEMRRLRTLVGNDEDAPELLAIALACARQRVVVKRPRLVPRLAGPIPHAHIAGPTTRYDLYLVTG